jgi:hypothetical protein
MMVVVVVGFVVVVVVVVVVAVITKHPTSFSLCMHMSVTDSSLMHTPQAVRLHNKFKLTVTVKCNF